MRPERNKSVANEKEFAVEERRLTNPDFDNGGDERLCGLIDQLRKPSG